MDEPDTQSDATSAPQFRTYASDVAKITGKPFDPQTRVVNTKAPPPKDVPYDPPPARIIPKAPSTDEAREAVLARLKQKAQGVSSPNVPAPADIPVKSNEREAILARLKATATTVQKEPSSVPGIPPVSKPPPIPSEAVSPLHTYKSDFAEKARSERASPLSVLAAEQNALGRKPVPQLKTAQRNYLPLIAGAVLLILAGGASIYFAVSFATGRPPVLTSPSVPSLIFADSYIELKGTGFELQEALRNLKQENLAEGTVAITYLTYASTTAKGQKVMLPAQGGVLIKALGITAPEILLRNVAPESSVGVIKTNGEVYPFFILKATSYERTFAGMLSWEETMERDLRTLYPSPEVAQAVGTSSKNASITQKPFAHVFVDAMIDNHDVRIVKNEEGRTILLYGYRDKETLIIARDEKAFAELMTRLTAARTR